MSIKPRGKNAFKSRKNHVFARKREKHKKTKRFILFALSFIYIQYHCIKHRYCVYKYPFCL